MDDTQKQLSIATEELRQMEERFQLVVNGTLDGIWDWPDSTKDEVYWSPQWKALLGYQDHELTGNKTTFYNLLHPEDRERCAAAVKDCLENDASFDIEYRLQKKSGEYGWFYGKGIVYRKNGITRMVGSITDIGKRKQAEEDNQRLLGKLVESNAELEQFTHIATHDLREPLRQIVNFTTLLEREYGREVGEEGKQYIEISRNAAIKMEMIITDLLKYSHLSGDSKNISRMDSHEKLLESLENLRESIQAAGARIHYGPLPVIMANPLYFNSLMQNLIVNAMKYQKPGNTPEIRIDAQEKSDCWEFTVADNGIGIREEYFDAIFVPFKRLHSQQEYIGTGLGLAICKRTVEKFGGAIWVTSTFGEGSVFHFTVPKEAAGV